MNNIRRYFLLFLMVFATAFVNAQKLGYVNSQAILSELPEVKQAEANLEAHKNAMQKKGQQMVTNLQNKYAALQQKEQRG